MDTSAGLRLRHTLYAVHTGLILHQGVRALAVDHKGHTLHTADAGLVRLDNLGLPVLALRIMLVHTVNLRSEKRRLVSAGTGTDLHNNVLIIIRIFRKKQNL